MTTRLMLAMLAVALAGCSVFRHGSAAPSSKELAEQYGCPPTVVDNNWRLHRFAPVARGTPMCATLGRYGDPVSIHSQSAAGMELLSLLHRPSGRYVDVTFVHYDDTPTNRELHRPIGHWIVQDYRSR